MRFLHTSDWQIGLKANHVPGAADAVRRARLETIDTIGKVACQEAVDFVVVAGDLFEDNHVGDSIAKEVLSRLQSYETEVYILPGNHDYYGRDSIYRRGVFQAPPQNVHIIANSEPIIIRDCVLFPCPVKQKRTMEQLTDGIPTTGHDGLIRIGVAHGSVVDFGSSEGLSIPASAAKENNLDYLALGHWHGFQQIGERTFYSGTHEQTKFAETGAGAVLVVDIAEPGALPRVKRVATGKLDWVLMDTGVADPIDESLARLETQLQQIARHDSTLVKLNTSGRVSVESRAAFARWAEQMQQRFLYFAVSLPRIYVNFNEGKLVDFCHGRPVAEGVLQDLKWLLELYGSESPARLEAVPVNRLQKLSSLALSSSDLPDAFDQKDIEEALAIFADIVEGVHSA